MKISAGPIALAKPGWGLKEGSVTAFVSTDAGGHPEVLTAQILCGAASSRKRVLLLLPAGRDEDPVWRTLVTMLTIDDHKSAASALRKLPILLHAWGTGRDRSDSAELVYAPGLSTRELRGLRSKTKAPILLTGKEFDEKSALVPVELIRVGKETLAVDAEGFEVSVVYDPSGPIYRPA